MPGKRGANRMLLFALVVAVSATSGLKCPNGVLYALGEDSAWLEGCIVGPCKCPILQLDDLTGTFQLAELPTLQPGPWRLFEVSGVRWKLRRGDQVMAIRGGGFYRTAAPVLDQHQLTLELTIDGDPLKPLDSGVVGGALEFPIIEIQALTPSFCYQEGVSLRAEPLGK